MTSAGLGFVFVHAMSLCMISALLLRGQHALDKSFDPFVVVMGLDISLLDEIWADRP